MAKKYVGLLVYDGQLVAYDPRIHELINFPGTVYGEDFPENPNTGTIFWNTISNEFFLYDGNQWFLLAIGTPVSGGGTTPPPSGTAPDPLNAFTLQPQTGVSVATGLIPVFSNLGTLTAGNSFDYVVNGDNIYTQTANTTRFGPADQGQLIAYINGTQVDTFDLAANFNESERDGSQSYPPATGINGIISVDSVQIYGTDPTQQIGSAHLILSGQLVPGYNEVKLEHVVNGSTVGTATQEIFYDDGITPTVDSVSLANGTGSSIFDLSGIHYIQGNVTFDLAISVSNLFDKTYLQQPIHITSDTGLDENWDWNVTGSTGYSNPPNSTDSWSYSGTITVPGGGSSVTVTVEAKDPFGTSAPVSSTVSNILSASTGTTSTSLNEYFYDENYRLPVGTYDTVPTAITGQWNSSAVLTNGNLQVKPGQLVYPTEDYTASSYTPSQTANYSTFVGDQEYYRAYSDPGNPHSNGTLHLRGVTWADLSGNIDIYYKIPGDSGWMTLLQYYDPGTFSKADGDGLLISYTDDADGNGVSIQYTLGTSSTGYANDMLIMKIVYHNANKVITEVSQTGW